MDSVWLNPFWPGLLIGYGAGAAVTWIILGLCGAAARRAPRADHQKREKSP